MNDFCYSFNYNLDDIDFAHLQKLLNGVTIPHGKYKLSRDDVGDRIQEGRTKINVTDTQDIVEISGELIKCESSIQVNIRQPFDLDGGYIGFEYTAANLFVASGCTCIVKKDRNFRTGVSFVSSSKETIKLLKEVFCVTTVKIC